MRLFFNTLIVSACVFLSFPGYMQSSTPPLEKNHTENVYVHTDRDIYVAGEYMHFKSYLLNINNDKNLQSGYLYLSLRSDDQIVKRNILPVEGSYSAGSLHLEDTLSTGYYELIAHTNWMKNHGEDSFFRKSVLIVNRFDQNPESILMDNTDGNDLKVSFHLESQSFIKGHFNKVLMNTEGNINTSLREVWILNQHNDTIKNTKLNTHGFCEFSIKPDSGYTYYASIDGIDDLYQLPEAKNRGSLLKIDQEKSDLNIKILPAEENPEIDWLRIMHKDNVVYEERIYDDHFTTVININDQDIPRGLLSIEIGAQGWGKIAQRFWYNDINDKSMISLEASSDDYGRRENVDLTIDGSLMEDEFASLSVSVAKAESVEKNSIDLDGYIRALNIAGEIGQNKREAVSLLGNMNLKQLNSYMIKIDGDKNINNQDGHNFSKDYYMETDGLIVSGNVVDSKSAEPVSDAKVILNTPDTIINMLYAKTDDKGVFNFVLTDYFYNKELYFFVDPNTVEYQTEINLSDKFKYKSPYEVSHFDLSKQRFDFIKKSQDIVRVNMAYQVAHFREKELDKIIESHPPQIFSDPQQTIYTDNYVPLDSLPEISRELVHAWRIRKNDGQYNSTLTCASTGNRFPEATVFFLDGIITYDVNKMIHLDSKKIEKLQIHNYNWVHGEMSFPGIIGIFTRNQAYLNILAHRTTTNLFKDAIEEPVEFNAPKYNHTTESESFQPDLRTVLFWKDDIVLNNDKTEKISFFSSDLKGKYYIKLQGITSGGKPININKPITIK